MKKFFSFICLPLLGVLSLLTRHTTGKPCSGQLIPGVEKMSRGVDITELDLTPNDLRNPSISGFRKFIVAFTCDQDIKWTTPDGTAYERPDQVDGANILPAGQIQTTIELSSSSEDYKQSRSLNVGLKVDTIKYGAFSASAGYKNVLQNLYKNNRSVAEVKQKINNDFLIKTLNFISDHYHYLLNASRL